MNQTDFPLLVLGLPRSGTLYTAKFLRHCGRNVGWEHFGPDGLVSWMAAATSADVPFGKAPTAGKRFAHRIAIVREPLATIASIGHVCMHAQSRERFLNYIRRFVLIPPDASPLATCVWFWAGWQKLVAAQAPARYFRVEDQHVELAAYLTDKMPSAGKSIEPLPAITTHHNGDPQPVTWESIDSEVPEWLAAEVRQFSTRFGYEP